MAQAPRWNLGIGCVRRARRDSPCKSWIGDIYYFSGVELKDFLLRRQRAETEGGLMPNCSPNCLNLLYGWYITVFRHGQAAAASFEKPRWRWFNI